MPSFLDDRVDSDAILGNIRNIVEIESPSRHAAGVNRVLETIARSFEGTGAASERELTTDSLGELADIAQVRRLMPRNVPVMRICEALEQRVVTPVRVTSQRNQRNQPKRDRAAYMRAYRARRA